jgi:hypothetical protein
MSLRDDQGRAVHSKALVIEGAGNFVANFERFGANYENVRLVVSDVNDEVAMDWDTAICLRDFLNEAVPVYRVPPKSAERERRSFDGWLIGRGIDPKSKTAEEYWVVWQVSRRA